MPGGGITVSNRVHARDDFGRFLAKLDGAAERTASQTIDVGMRSSKSAAPYRTGQLSKSFYKQMMGHSGIYFNLAPYAKFQDQGAAPNDKPGNVSFFWEHEAKWWTPGTNTINHPGNPATRFMDAGWKAMQAAATGIMRRNYG